MQQAEQKEEFSFKSLFLPLTTIKAIHIIVIVGLIVFGNALFNQFVWDDVVLFYSGDTYRSITNIGYIFLDHSMPYYRPVPLVILATLYTLFGDSVFWYHLFGITLHIINTIILYVLFKKFISNRISFFLSLIFLVHPMQVEAVSYISSIINPLFLFFGLTAMLITQMQKLKNFYKYSLVSVLFLLAILTKEAGFLFMVFIPLYMILISEKKIKKKVWYYLSFSYLVGLIPFIYLRFFITNVVSVESTYTPIPIMNASFYERLITLPKIISYYITTLIFPKDLAISQQWVVAEISYQNFFLPLAVAICFFSFFLWSIFFIKNNKRKLFVYLFFLLWFLLSWGLHWNIVHPLDMTVADRWFYLPLVGLLGAVGIIVSEIKFSNEFIKRTSIIAVIIVITLFSFRTMARNLDWKDPLTLYLKDSKISTESYDLETQLGEQLTNKEKYAEAKPHLDKAIQLAPDFWANWAVLGRYYVKTNQIDKAIHSFSKSIDNNPGHNLAYIFLADTYFINKSPKETKSFLAKALKKHPTDPYFLYLNGITEYRLGNKEKGMKEVLRAYDLNKNEKFLAVYNLMQKDEHL